MSADARIWEVLFKIAVPLSFLAAGAMISHEVRLAGHDDKLARHESMLASHQESISEMPSWLRLNLANKIDGQGMVLAEVQALLKSIEARLTRLEGGAAFRPQSK